MLIDYAVQKNWEIYKIYSDDDYTGADRNRPEFNSLLKDASERKFDIILCKTQARFTRELEIVKEVFRTGIHKSI
jgi:DNA invertase Pin-like site-specific DNA recombinase